MKVLHRMWCRAQRAVRIGLHALLICKCNVWEMYSMLYRSLRGTIDDGAGVLYGGVIVDGEMTSKNSSARGNDEGPI